MQILLDYLFEKFALNLQIFILLFLNLTTISRTLHIVVAVIFFFETNLLTAASFGMGGLRL